MITGLRYVLGPPQHRSLQQRGLLFVRPGFTPSGLEDSLPLRFVGGLQHHCVRLWAVSTFLVRVFPAASGHGVILWFVQHRWAAIDSRVSLCRLTSLTEICASSAARFARSYMSLSCHFHTLLPFTCADDSRLSLSCTRAAIPTILNFAVNSPSLG